MPMLSRSRVSWGLGAALLIIIASSCGLRVPLDSPSQPPAPSPGSGGATSDASSQGGGGLADAALGPDTAPAGTPGPGLADASSTGPGKQPTGPDASPPVADTRIAEPDVATIGTRDAAVLRADVGNPTPTGGDAATARPTDSARGADAGTPVGPGRDGGPAAFDAVGGTPGSRDVGTTIGGGREAGVTGGGREVGNGAAGREVGNAGGGREVGAARSPRG